MIKTTHTYVTMEVSKSTYDEIYKNLKNAGYDHAISKSGNGFVLDMHGIALVKEDGKK